MIKEKILKFRDITDKYENNERKIMYLKKIRGDFAEYINGVKNLLDNSFGHLEEKVKRKSEKYATVRSKGQLTLNMKKMLSMEEKYFSKSRKIDIPKEDKKVLLEKIDKTFSEDNIVKDELEKIIELIDECAESGSIVEKKATINMLEVAVENKYFESQIALLEMDNANLLEGINKDLWSDEAGINEPTRRFIDKWLSKELVNNGLGAWRSNTFMYDSISNKPIDMGLKNIVTGTEDKVLLLQAAKIRNSDITAKENYIKDLTLLRNIRISKARDNLFVPESESEKSFDSMNYTDKIEFFSDNERMNFNNLNNFEKRKAIIQKIHITKNNYENDIVKYSTKIAKAREEKKEEKEKTYDIENGKKEEDIINYSKQIAENKEKAQGKKSRKEEEEKRLQDIANQNKEREKVKYNVGIIKGITDMCNAKIKEVTINKVIALKSISALDVGRQYELIEEQKKEAEKEKNLEANKLEMKMMSKSELLDSDKGILKTARMDEIGEQGRDKGSVELPKPEEQNISMKKAWQDIENTISQIRKTIEELKNEEKQEKQEKNQILEKIKANGGIRVTPVSKDELVKKRKAIQEKGNQTPEK